MNRTVLEKVGSLLYMVNPNRTTFQYYRDIPNYVDEAIPYFLFFIVIEFLIRTALGRETRMVDSMTNFAIGTLHEATVFVSGFIMFFGYEWLYQYRLLSLPWDSIYTWFGAFVFVDFCYYWIHRANHEINFLWAAHQVHHSSEDYNLLTSFRLSIFQRATYIGFYHPLALLGFPFPMVVVHAAFNYLFQFWVHTDLVRSTGPLEYIFMSPSHHRVHHGANKWCLDKNYASVFVIWDRIFGTFEAERANEEIVYGLTDPPQTANAIWHEFYYFGIIYRKFKSMTNWTDSLKAIFYGPGWSPGTPRLGDPDTFPDIKAPRQKYDPKTSFWLKAYTGSHMLAAFLAQQQLVSLLSTVSWLTVLVYLSFLFLTMGIIGAMYDGKWWAGILEAMRCAAVISYGRTVPITSFPLIDTIVLSYFSVSMMIWMMHSMIVLKPSIKSFKVE